MADQFHEEEVLGKAYDARLMRRLLGYLRPYWHVAAAALAAIILYGMLQAIPPYLLKVEVDRYLDPAGRQIAGPLARILSPDPLTGILELTFIFFLPTVVLSFVLEFAQSFAMQIVGQKVMYDLRKQILMIDHFAGGNELISTLAESLDDFRQIVVDAIVKDAFGPEMHQND